eukprot:TRINITY_DN726_c0_g1_i3.p1 TRINITY_DN726_c0_g1~~TRINITY_DN726_c0_g1_i3.p1  ORF type:complete len:102 (+),score=20.58 TRINITY_DN726_c0_g1_i3:133-438(+)
MKRSPLKGFIATNKATERKKRFSNSLKRNRQRVIERLKKIKKEEWKGAAAAILGHEFDESDWIEIEEIMHQELLEQERQYLEEQANECTGSRQYVTLSFSS